MPEFACHLTDIEPQEHLIRFHRQVNPTRDHDIDSHTVMSNSSKPHPLARQFQDFQRQSAKGYVCPFCTDSDNRFTQELKLWQHAKAQHQDLVGHLDPSDEADARKRLRINAMDRAYVITCQCGISCLAFATPNISTSEGCSMHHSPWEMLMCHCM